MENPFANIKLPDGLSSSPSLNESVFYEYSSESSIVDATRNLGKIYEASRADLKPEVRSYVDRVYAKLLNLYKKYGARKAIEVHANVISGKGPKLEKKDVEEIVRLLDILDFAITKNELPKGEDFSRFILQDIPKFPEGLPPQFVFTDKMGDYGFDWVDQNFSEGRNTKDFLLTEGDLEAVGFDDEGERKRLLGEMISVHENEDVEREAMVFDTSETLIRKIKDDPEHPNYLTTKEVIEAIDATGYRPASFEELLCFARDFWKPGMDQGVILDADGHRINRPGLVYAIGGSYTGFFGGVRNIPCLYWRIDESRLSCDALESNWSANHHFLAIPKTS